MEKNSDSSVNVKGEVNRQEAMLELLEIEAGYDSKVIIENINFTLKKAEIISVIGPSGIGKSTLFNVIAGLLKPYKGKVILDGKEITNQSGFISYMLQKDLLLPFKTVGENIALPLILKGVKKKDALREVEKYLDDFGLAGTSKSYPSSLSGGMKQRAALLRTYMMDNKVSLLDEPFSALDSLSKNKMHEWFLDLLKRIDMSAIFITHDIDEAIKLSDRIYVLKGRPATLVREFVVDIAKDKRNSAEYKDEVFAIKEQIMSELEN